MIDPGNVPSVADEELLARFVTQSGQFRKVDNTVKQDLFVPNSRDEVSVMRYRSATEAEIWEVGCDVAAALARPLYGRSDKGHGGDLGSRNERFRPNDNVLADADGVVILRLGDLRRHAGIAGLYGVGGQSPGNLNFRRDGQALGLKTTQQLVQVMDIREQPAVLHVHGFDRQLGGLMSHETQVFPYPAGWERCESQRQLGAGPHHPVLGRPRNQPRRRQDKVPFLLSGPCE
jgi:hypothetical protein